MVYSESLTNMEDTRMANLGHGQEYGADCDIRQEGLKDPADKKSFFIKSGWWYEIHFNPRNYLKMSSKLNVPPWYANRPNHGRVLNHPALPPAAHFKCEWFLSSFHDTCESDLFWPQDRDSFIEGFPSFPPKKTTADLFEYHKSVVAYCSQFGIYVPPIHTYLPGEPHGAWFELLPSSLQRSVAMNFSYLLAECLKAKCKASCVAPLLECTNDGYDILYRFADWWDHPALCELPGTIIAPTQGLDDTLSVYCNAWLEFLDKSFMNGKIFSDRWFIESFLVNLQEPFKSLLQPEVTYRSCSFELQKALAPMDFGPTKLYSYLVRLLPPGLRMATARAVSASVRPVIHLKCDFEDVNTDDNASVQVVGTSNSVGSLEGCQQKGHDVNSRERFDRVCHGPVQSGVGINALAHSGAGRGVPPAIRSGSGVRSSSILFFLLLLLLLLQSAK